MRQNGVLSRRRVVELPQVDVGVKLKSININ